MDSSITIDMTELYQMLRVGEKVLPVAGARALNRGISSIRQPVAREVAQKENIRPQRLIAKRIRLRKARSAFLVGSIEVLTRAVPAILITGVRDTKKTGVRIPGRSWPDAFIAKGRGGNKVFYRRGRTRLPLGVVRVEIETATVQAIEKRLPDARDKMLERLPHEIAHRMEQLSEGV